MDERQEDREKEFVEEVGLVFEQTGMPRMAGRIFGWLLIADPPHQSTDELAEALLASKGSISTMTRMLIQNGLIEKVSLPGIRHDYFRLHSDAWQHTVRRGLEDEIKMFGLLAGHGLELVSGKASHVRKRLEQMREVYAFLGQGFTVLMEKLGKNRVRATRL